MAHAARYCLPICLTGIIVSTNKYFDAVIVVDNVVSVIANNVDII